MSPTRKLRVYGAAVFPAYDTEVRRLLRESGRSPHGQTRAIVKTTSLTAATKLLGRTRDYISETGNSDELAAVERVEPGTLLYWVPGRTLRDARLVTKDGREIGRGGG